MKVPANDLFKVIREIVKDELQRQLPVLVAEGVRRELSEAYIKRLVSESNSPRTGSNKFSDLLDSEDVVPEPQNPIADDDEGIYNANNPKLIGNQVASKLLAKDNPLSFVYEGVQRPGSHPNGGQVSPGEVPLNVLQSLGADFKKMAGLSRALEGGRSGPVPETANQKMRELEERRRLLEVPASSMVLK